MLIYTAYLKKNCCINIYLYQLSVEINCHQKKDNQNIEDVYNYDLNLFNESLTSESIE